MDRDTTIDPTEVRDVRIDRAIARGKWFAGAFGVLIATSIGGAVAFAFEGQARLDALESRSAEREAALMQIAADTREHSVQMAELRERIEGARAAQSASNEDLKERIESLREDVRRRPR
jgi:hypothetical protein